jgi:aromatic-L-amino-acid decarboxylase
MAHRELARTDRFSESVARVLGPIEEFLRFEGRDPAAQRSRWMPLLDEPLPERGHGANAVLEALADVVIPYGSRVGAPGFSGWVTTMPSIVPAVAGFAGSIATPQRWWVSPGNFLEVLAIRWLAELLGLSRNVGGTFTSGGAVANLVCLGAARQNAGERIGADPSADGAAAIPSPRVYAPASVHRVVTRALAILGLGARCFRPIPCDGKRIPILSELERAIDADIAQGATPVAVVASAGDVHTGAIDPIDDMRAVAHARGVWLHVDGAYGGFGVLDERVRPLFGDLTRVDSLAVDPHKWLAVPVGCGAALVRDVGVLERAFAIERADYVKFERRGDSDPGSPFDELGDGSPDVTVDHSAPCRGLTVWAALKELGAAGMRDRVARHLDCARRVAALVQAHDDLELLSEPVLSICCFRYHPPAIRDTATLERLNEAIAKEVRARARAVPSTTRVNGKLAIRPCFIGPRTELEDADALVEEVLAVGRELANDPLSRVIPPGRRKSGRTEAE